MGQIKTQVSHLINKVWHHPPTETPLQTSPEMVSLCYSKRHFDVVFALVSSSCLLPFAHYSPLTVQCRAKHTCKELQSYSKQWPVSTPETWSTFLSKLVHKHRFFFYPPAAVWSNGATMWQQQGSERVKPSLTVWGVTLHISWLVYLTSTTNCLIMCLCR